MEKDQDNRQKRTLVSVIIPVYNEEQVIDELLSRILSLCTIHSVYHWEIIFIDDGSNDQTLQLLNGAAVKDSRIKIVQLSRNFGQQEAITAGIDFSSGDVVAIIDGDLQDPPEMIPEMLELWENGADVVYAVRQNRKESYLKRFLYSAYYRLLKWSADIKIPLDSGDCCVMDKKVVKVLTKIPDRSRYLRGLRAWVGFQQVPFRYERQRRRAGTAKYTYRKLFLLALDGMISFSEMPLRLGMLIGLLLVILSLAYAIFLVIWAICSWETRPKGFATIMMALSFLSGIQLLVMSLLGEYIIRIFKESKTRPLYVVTRTMNLPKKICNRYLGINVSSESKEEPRDDYNGKERKI